VLARNLTDLTLWGWCLVVATCAVVVASAWPIGNWVLRAAGNTYIRENKGWLVPVLCIPSLLVGAAFLLLGARLLARLGLPLVRRPPPG
jgi:hypothetical protein